MNDPLEIPPPPVGDHSQRFLFEDADIRGETVCLDNAYRDIVAIHQYPPGVSRLLGEFLAAAVLLSTTLKFQGKLILQVRSEGQIPLLMVECSSALEVRGIAPQELLYRLYHQDPVRLFTPSPVAFRCSCSRERTRHALSSLNTAELEDLLEELGSITMDCEFCNQQYRFNRDDLADILGGEQAQTLH